jgi:hypothetical protein
MPIAKITGQGLAAIAVSVALLWACVIGQRVLQSRAVEERMQVMRQLQPSQGKWPRPVSFPEHRRVHPPVPDAG